MENKIPDNWVECKFGDVAKIHNGYAFETRDFRRDKGVPLIKQSQLNGDKVDLTKCVYLDESFLVAKKDFVLKKGDVLIGMSGSVGKMCLYDLDFPALQNQRTGKAVPYSEKLLNKKLFWYFLSTIESILLEKGKGLGVSNVSAEDIEDLVFNLPPLSEQQRIVTKLDALFEKLESNKQRLDKIPKLLKRFRQSVLAAAVSGRLTEEWRTKNNSIKSVNIQELSKERERLQKENAKRKGQKTFSYNPPVEIELGERTKGVDELYELPENWNWVSLDSCVWSVSDGPHFSPKYVEKENGIAFISSRNISYDNIDFSDAKYISEEDYKEFIKRGKPENDDILLTKGGTTGIAHKVNTEIDFSIWVHVALLKLIKKFVNPNYFRDVLTSDFLYRQSQAQTHGVGNQDLGLTRMIFMTIPLPPLEEQKEIVRIVEQLFAFADKIEARYSKAKTMLDKLPQSILAKAFRGELVAQDPNDEPASVLLERIQAEKELLKNNIKGKKRTN